MEQNQPERYSTSSPRPPCGHRHLRAFGHAAERDRLEKRHQTKTEYILRRLFGSVQFSRGGSDLGVMIVSGVVWAGPESRP